MGVEGAAASESDGIVLRVPASARGVGGQRGDRRVERGRVWRRAHGDGGGRRARRERRPRRGRGGEWGRGRRGGPRPTRARGGCRPRSTWSCALGRFWRGGARG